MHKSLLLWRGLPTHLHLLLLHLLLLHLPLLMGHRLLPLHLHLLHLHLHLLLLRNWRRRSLLLLHLLLLHLLLLHLLLLHLLLLHLLLLHLLHLLLHPQLLLGQFERFHGGGLHHAFPAHPVLTLILIAVSRLDRPERLGVVEGVPVVYLIVVVIVALRGEKGLGPALLTFGRELCLESCRHLGVAEARPLIHLVLRRATSLQGRIQRRERAGRARRPCI
jgi:hypothetical protein